MRWPKDETDLWCQQWADQRRKILGLSELEPRDRLGKLNSTLGAVREDGEGASQGVVNQNFPEVYTGLALLVNRAWHEMNPRWRPVMEAHYVYREQTKAKAHALAMAVDLYWSYLNYAKNYVHSYVCISNQLHRETRKARSARVATQNTAVKA